MARFVFRGTPPDGISLVAPLFGEAKSLALLCSVCHLEYQKRVAQENVTFALPGRAKGSPLKRSGGGCSATRCGFGAVLGRFPRAANVHETAKRIEPERRTQRHGQHRDQPSSQAILQQIPDPAPESGSCM